MAGIVRITILAVLLGAVALGWSYFASHQETASFAPAAEQQQMADNNATQPYAVAPEAAPAPAPVAAAPTPRPTSAAPARRSAPRAEPEMTEPMPAPVTTTPAPIDAGASPTPLPPSGF